MIGRACMKKDGDELFDHYRHTLEELGKQKGLLGLIFTKSQNKFQDPAKLRRLIVDLIDKETWVSMSADVKGDAYEGLLEKNAQDTKSGAGQYFTPRPLIQAIVDAMAPRPGETISDPACGTGGFLLAAHDYVVKHYPNMTSAEKKKLRGESFKGWELVQATARLCAMNMLLHGIGSQEFEPIAVGDSLAADPGERFDVVLTNPPFGKKSSTTIVGRRGQGQQGTRQRRARRLLGHHFEQAAQLRPAREDAAEAERPRRRGTAGQRAIRRRGGRDDPPQTAARVRRPHPTAPAHGALLRPGREGERAVLRQEARQPKLRGPGSCGSTTCAPTCTSRSRPAL